MRVEAHREGLIHRPVEPLESHSRPKAEKPDPVGLVAEGGVDEQLRPAGDARFWANWSRNEGRATRTPSLDNRQGRCGTRDPPDL